MCLRRSQKSVQDLTLLGHEETKQNSNENNKPNSILTGKVSSTSKFAKKKGMCYATRVKNVSSPPTLRVTSLVGDGSFGFAIPPNLRFSGTSSLTS